MFIYQGLKIKGPVTIGGNTYPVNFWPQITPAQRQALGVTEVADPVMPDPVMNVVTENPDGTYTAIPRPLAEFQAKKIQELSAACATSIYAGFSSNALGAVYFYPSGDKDQSNLAASVLASLMPNVTAGWTTPFLCTDAADNWQYRPHTVAQIQQVGVDAKAAILVNVTKNATLAAQVMAMVDIPSVIAVKW